jgi:DHA1 family multidrug resistance protein-like MFS transporter
MRSGAGNRRGLVILGGALFVTMVGFGLAMPVLPGRVAELGGSGASYGLLVAISSATMLAAGPAWGILSDRIGRKPVLIAGLAGLAGSLIGFAAADTMGALLAARAASGVLAAAVQPAALAYAADSTLEKQRGAAIGRLMGFLALGVVIGPGLGGVLGEGSMARPFLVGAALTAASAVLVLVLVPETRTRCRDEASERESRGMRTEAHPRLWGLLALVAIATFGTSCFQAVFGLDAVRRFAMTPAWIGLVLVVTGGSAALMQGLASGVLSRRLGDARVARLSLVGGALGFAALGAAGSASAYLAASGLYVLAHALLRPSLQTLASTHAGGRQGRALGLANAAQGIGSTLGPLSAGPLLDVSAVWPYALGAAALVLGLGASFFLIPKGDEQ